MEMAGKEETEGRCPACRTPYNKAKVVGMAANCERLTSENKYVGSRLLRSIFDLFMKSLLYLYLRLSSLSSWTPRRLVAEMNMERKVKSQKAKSKGSESRKHLSSVRVIQRNLVYIVGLPLNLADEDVCIFSLSSAPLPFHSTLTTSG